MSFPNIPLVERKCPRIHTRHLKMIDNVILSSLLVRESISFIFAITCLVQRQSLLSRMWVPLPCQVLLILSSSLSPLVLHRKYVTYLSARVRSILFSLNYIIMVFAVRESFGENYHKVGCCPLPPLADREHDTCLRFTLSSDALTRR